MQDPWTPDETMVRKKFDHYDKDTSGNLDENEILALAQVPLASIECARTSKPRAPFHGDYDVMQDLWLAFHPKSAPLDSEHTRELAAELMKRVDEKNGNNDGLVDFDEFLPWYAKIAEKHYKFVNGMPYIEAEVRYALRMLNKL